MGEAIANRYLEAWGKPFGEDEPCGEDISFSSEFEALRAEVEKDTSLHATESTDWIVVARLTAEMLETQSKDIWLLVYAVYAEYRTAGLDASPEAFAALTEILRQFWEHIHPQRRLPRRLAPLVWLCGRMEHAAKTTSFLDGSSTAVNALREAFTALQELLHEKFADTAPSFSGIFSRIPEAVEQVPTEEAPAQPQDAAPAQTRAPARAPEPAVPSSAGSDEGRIAASALPQLIRTIIEQSRQLAGHFLLLNPLDERSYLLHRAALWGTLLQSPLADATGKTQLTSGIPKDRIQTYTAAVEAKQYAEILPHLERSAGKAPFWLDGHVMVLHCLEGLKATSAAACLRECLSALLTRFPELVGYSFRDGSPFASPKSVSALENLRSAASGNNMFAGMVDAGEGEGSEETFQEAVRIGQEENFQAGLHHLGSVPPGRHRAAVLHALRQARYCIALEKKEAAERLLSVLYRQMEEWNLLDWEPDLTARILALVCTHRSQREGGDAAAVFCRLQWLHWDMELGIAHEN